MYYLKYRPKSFSELVGIEEIVRALTKALIKNQVAHAYIFTGPKGSGKTTTARILARALNCEKLQENGEPCDQCSHCQSLNEGKYLDLIEIDAASNRGIDDVRSLKEKIKLAPTQGKYKVYIVDEAHMLTSEAFNALLKTLEEPPAHAVFILATTEFQKLPPTIRSRCQVLRFARAKKADLIKKLTLISQREEANISSEQIERIAQLSEGGFRNGETLLEQVVVGGIALNEFSLSPGQFLALLINGNKTEALVFLSSLAERGESLNVFNQELVFYLRKLLLILGGVSDEVLELAQEESAAMKTQAAQITSPLIIKLIGRFLEAQEQAKFSPVAELPLELAVFEAVNYFFESISQPSSKQDRPLLEDGPVQVGGLESLPNPAPPVVRGDGKILTLTDVVAHWEEILRAVKPFNHSLEALLRSSRPKEFSQNGDLIIEVFYKFHKDKLSATANMTILSNVFDQVLGYRPSLNFALGERIASSSLDATAKADSNDIVSAALEAFGT